MKNIRILILSIISTLAVGLSPCHAREIINFGPEETKIIGSIPYTVLGLYKAQFDRFKGRIILDRDSTHVQSVYLEIEAKSIRSNSPWCDKLARSRRLLDTARYPKIIFKSNGILRDQEGYKVKGILEMRGIKRLMLLPFKVKTVINPFTQRRVLDIKGDWRINRKYFNIVWSRTLDHGGVLVGDYLTVDWEISIPS